MHLAFWLKRKNATVFTLVLISPQICHKACEPPRLGARAPACLFLMAFMACEYFRNVVDYATKTKGYHIKTKRCDPNSRQKQFTMRSFIFPVVSTSNHSKPLNHKLAEFLDTGQFNNECDEFSCDGLFFPLLNCPQAFWMTQNWIDSLILT